LSIKTDTQYFESLEELDFKVYMFGEKITDLAKNPIIAPSRNSVAKTYELANSEKHEELVTANSHLTGKRINRFTHLHRSKDDLIKKVNMLRLLGQKTATCFQRCVGMDALNAIDSVTFEMDQALGTKYHQRFTDFLHYVQEEDLVCDGAMTDPKGDRGKKPGEQHDPDLYLRLIEKNEKGIIVRGAKVHQTGAINSHEVIVMPTTALGEEDRDYAICFAIPADSEGIFYVYGRQSCDTRKLEEGTIDVGNSRYGGQEATIVFDNVFVPWERVFMCGEYQFAGKLVERFASYHRQSYGGCKVGVGDVLIGAASCLAECQGCSKASHVKDKLIEMVHLNETIYSCGIACSANGVAMPSGTYLVDTLLANICKQNVTRFPYEITRLAEDIAGGLLVTMPSEQDFKSPEVGPILNKYFQGLNNVPIEYRSRMLRLVENLTMGTGAVGYRTESMHGAGSPQAQRIVIGRNADFENKKNLAKAIVGITDNCC